jgi:acetate kinase
VRIDDEVMEALHALEPLAPLHQPANLAGVHAFGRACPVVPQVACFDTAFHQTQSRLSSTYALPRELTESGIKRYGFHGQSYEYVSLQLPGVLGDKAHGAVVVAHLGNGASMCAMRDLKCVTTSMGFTALEGLMMGTRTGSIDPGILLYLMEHRGYDVASLSRLLYRESGLLGVSGISNDMRTLEASDKPEAREAIDLFCYRVARDIGSMAVALGGFDALVFTGGIGENGCAIRTQIVKHLAWMGMAIDEKANVRKSTAFRMDTPESRIAVAVVPTNEEWMIASHTAHLIASVAKLATA